jgi:hypothetical protein
MTVERAVTAFAGFMVLLSLALWWLVHPGFIFLTAFVGFNLLQSSFTGFCPAAMVFRKLGIKTAAEAAHGQSGGRGLGAAA